MKIFSITIIILSLFLITASRALAVMVIDNFSDNPLWKLDPLLGQTLTRLDTGLADVIGQSRLTSITYNYGQVYWNVGIGVGPSYLSLACDPTTYGNLSTYYDANGNGLNADFSGADFIAASFYPDHLGFGKPVIMSLELTDNNNTAFTSSRAWPVYIEQPGWLEEKFYLSEFSGVDSSNIKSIKFQYDGDSANDVLFDYLIADTSIPEPATLSLLGLGLFGIALAKKRKISKI